MTTAQATPTIGWRVHGQRLQRASWISTREVGLSAWAVARWCWRHTQWVFAVTVLAAVCTLVWGRPVGLGVLATGWVAPAVGLALWRQHRAVSYERRVEGPRRRWRQRRWARTSWAHVARQSGLGVVETVDRRSLRGERWTEKICRVPDLKTVKTSETGLFITARALVGQTSDDVARMAPALADAANARSVRARVVAPGTVRFELRMADYLAVPFTAQVPPASPTPGSVWVDSVRLGLREDAQQWFLPLAGRHTLVVGCSNSGKGSLVWGIAGELAPAVACGLVRLYGIDLKYGVELSMGGRLFAGMATTEEQALVLLERLDQLVAERGQKMAGQVRSHTATKEAPFAVLIIDELASLTAYMSDNDARKAADRLLRSILSKGRAMGVVVIGAIQDPRKEALPARGLFTQTIALRLRSSSEVSMVLGDGMQNIAPADKIPDTQPGTGYVIEEDGTAIKVRAAFWPDDVIRATAGRYPSPVTESLDPPTPAEGTSSTAAPAKPTVGDERMSGEAKPRKPRSPRTPRSTATQDPA